MAVTTSPDEAQAGLGAVEEVERALTVLVRRGSHPRAHERLMARAGVALDRSSYVILGRIADGEASRVSELAASLGVDVSTVSRQVTRLEESGLLERLDDPRDRRASSLRLTREGGRLLRQLRRARRDALTEMLSTWPDDDRAELGRLLTRLTDDLIAYTARD